MFEPAPALGMTNKSTNEEIKATAFEFLLDIGYVVLSTTAMDGKNATSRGIELHKLDDSGLLYLGISKGKPIYDELKAYPYLVGTIVKDTVKRLSVAVRISSSVEEVDDEILMAKYWELNPGTKSLYRKDLDNFKLFRLSKGEGEIFHVCEDDKVARVRFTFGGGSIRPFRYHITDECTSCGICAEACLTSVISPGDDKYQIDHYGCFECGKCYEVCPFNAISKEV